MGGRRVAVIGQAFPYTPIANPARFIPDWSFGIRDSELQELVNSIRAEHSPDAVVVLGLLPDGDLDMPSHYKRKVPPADGVFRVPAWSLR